ncbi:DegV family protein [Chloroflexus aggregans]|uniref:DegV family protein n=1 Tax=Chloroflexus aggregans (strain MD-66 / DSM 9485) TaxID=326427 RepID=B8GAA1_CHLAD|nr:DegV family protein [Chloroflexus aggregans]ACL26476.1 degV family protein [Chloroflexus aggregans DSM 9485]
MALMKVVTDGASDIPFDVTRELDIEVVPLSARIDDRLYRIGIDISEDQVYDLLFNGHDRVEIVKPTATTFEQLYRSLLGRYDYVFSIHLSHRLGTILSEAQAGRSRLPASNTRIEIIDSKLVGMGLGSIAIAAARAIRDGHTPAEVSELIGQTIRHTHTAFFVDTMEYLEQSGLLTFSSSLIGSMQRIKPLMILDEGEIVPYERTRTRAKAIEGLFTFVEDFPHVEDVIIHYATTPEDVEKLLEKLDPIFPRDRVQVSRMGPAIASRLGPGAMAVTVFEGFDEE